MAQVIIVSQKFFVLPRLQCQMCFLVWLIVKKVWESKPSLEDNLMFKSFQKSSHCLLRKKKKKPTFLNLDNTDFITFFRSSVKVFVTPECNFSTEPILFEFCFPGMVIQTSTNVKYFLIWSLRAYISKGWGVQPL